MNKGFFIVDRDLIDRAYAISPKCGVLMLVLLRQANWAKSVVVHNGKPYELQPGELVSSLTHLSFLTGLGIQEVRTALKLTHGQHMTNTRSTRDGSVISICNWNEIQRKNSELTDNQQATNTQLTTLELIKELNNINIAQSDQENPESRGKLIEPKKPSFDFEAVYKLYPRRVKKSVGIKKLQKTVKTQEQFDKLVKATKNIAEEYRRKGTEEQFMMHWPTFVSCWEDYINMESSGSVTNKNSMMGKF